MAKIKHTKYSTSTTTSNSDTIKFDRNANQSDDSHLKNVIFLTILIIILFTILIFWLAPIYGFYIELDKSENTHANKIFDQWNSFDVLVYIFGLISLLFSVIVFGGFLVNLVVYREYYLEYLRYEDAIRYRSFVLYDAEYRLRSTATSAEHPITVI